jgi:hypothetical protein
MLIVFDLGDSFSVENTDDLFKAKRDGDCGWTVGVQVREDIICVIEVPDDPEDPTWIELNVSEYTVTSDDYDLMGDPIPDGLPIFKQISIQQEGLEEILSVVSRVKQEVLDSVQN